MSKFNVFLNTGGKTVVIAREGYGPVETDSDRNVGSFEIDIDEANGQTRASQLTSKNGDHPFVTRAREIVAAHLGLDDNEVQDKNRLNGFAFLDQTSNAPAHGEIFTSTNDLPESGGHTHPDGSSQLGGIVNPGADPAETEANGVTPTDDRTDHGETEDTSDQSDRNKERSRAPDSSEPDQKTEDEIDGVDDNKALPGQPADDGTDSPEQVIEETTENQGETQEEEVTKTEQLDPGSLTVEKLIEKLATISDKAELERLYAAEQAGKDRASAIKAIEDRAGELA